MSKKDDRFNELIGFQSAEIKEWITQIDNYLVTGGCKAAVDNKGNFTYTSANSKKIVCRITMSETACSIRPNTNNATSSNRIAAELPEGMLSIMRDARGCGGCAKKNPSFVACKHGGPYRFTHDNEDFESCRFVGFNFALDDVANRDLLAKWLETELTFAE